MWNITSLCSEKYGNKSEQLSVQNLKRKNTVHVCKHINTCADVSKVTYLWTILSHSNCSRCIFFMIVFMNILTHVHQHFFLVSDGKKNGVRWGWHCMIGPKRKGGTWSMCWMLTKQKVLLACHSSELSGLELQGLSPYNTLTRKRERWTFPHQIPLIQHW